MADGTLPRLGHWPEVTEEVLQAMLAVVSDGVWDWNANTGQVYRSHGWYQLLGYAPDALRNTMHSWTHLIHPDDYAPVMGHFDACLQERLGGFHIQYRCRCQDGSYRLIDDQAQVVARNPDRSVARMVGAYRLVQPGARHLEQLQLRNDSLEQMVDERTRALEALNLELRRQLDENRQLAETDTLTRAANRYRFEQVLSQACEQARSFRQPLSLIALDLDGFKLINDRHGHSCGDRALVSVAQAISQCIRQVDTLARWGGDEFMLVLPSTRQADANALALRIQRQIASLPPVGQCSLAVSFGVAQFEGSGDQADLLLRADRALYRCKAAGKRQACAEAPRRGGIL
ncbi:diguanylate cyclase domain-containing protein [Pseudomonas sp. NPDC007930]|uniref:sensor domain-containing diguanylate cyclase n=1 Tax=Pseudomonas sp. NPDC007930 TaxID=3364417 RepID=UPI0036EC487A